MKSRLILRPFLAKPRCLFQWTSESQAKLGHPALAKSLLGGSRSHRETLIHNSRITHAHLSSVHDHLYGVCATE
jgi:hypothetical protein